MRTNPASKNPKAAPAQDSLAQRGSAGASPYRGKAPPAQDSPPQPLLFMVLAGVFFFIAVVKLGVPVVLDAEVSPPDDWLDAVFGSSNYTWHVKWGYLLMAPVFLAGLLAIRWKPFPSMRPGPISDAHRAPLQRRFLLLPLLWLGWQFVSAAASGSPRLTSLVLAHFSACVAFFYLGFFALRGVRNPWPIWAGLALACCWTLHIAMEQHFGGLEATRKLILESNPTAQALAKTHDLTRVFGTFMYPNALAAGLLLLLPVSLVFLWQLVPKLRAGIRALFVTILGGCGLACLYWSGSKAALLFMVLLGVLAIGHSPLRMSWKRVLIYGLLALGFIAFTIKYADSAARGKRSMEARTIYWQAALQIVRQHPVLGTGPGTFGVANKQFLPANAEWAMMAHNDYLEQASDSGIIGFLAYSALIVGSIAYLYRYRLLKTGRFHAARFAVWLGLLGLFLHSGMEFNLYYPALAWPSFFLLGWLWGLEEE
jgi:O-antigen ligase